MSRTVICLIDYYHAGLFFLRIAKNDSDNTYVFVTTLPSIHLKAKQIGFRSQLLTKAFVVSRAASVDDLQLRGTREAALGILTPTQQAILCSQIIQKAGSFVGRGDTVICCWNGSTVMGVAARHLKKKLKVKTLFFEIANIPGKLFVDPEGCNAQSRLYRDPEGSLPLEADLFAYEEWRSSYIRVKKEGLAVPQAKLGAAVGWHHIIDYLFMRAFGFCMFSDASFEAKLKKTLNRFWRGRNAQSNLAPLNPPDGPFIFFPMQVSNDTQLLLNSDVSNIEALKRLLAETSLPIVVKPHPAELDRSYINKWITETADARIVLSEGNTFELLDKSDSVVTINSTVGLEAKLLNKEIRFLGKSFYSKLSRNTLPAYVTEYLIDIDFFVDIDTPIAPTSLEKIFKRAAQ